MASASFLCVVSFGIPQLKLWLDQPRAGSDSWRCAGVGLKPYPPHLNRHPSSSDRSHLRNVRNRSGGVRYYGEQYRRQHLSLGDSAKQHLVTLTRLMRRLRMVAFDWTVLSTLLEPRILSVSTVITTSVAQMATIVVLTTGLPDGSPEN